MQDDELRALIRDAIARHLDGGAGCSARRSLEVEAASSRPPHLSAAPPQAWKTHLSHGRFVFLAPTEPDSPCVVEPQVRCHHCGFCQSYGH